MKVAWRWLAAVALSTALTACGGGAARKDTFLARGDQYFAEKNYDKARVEYSNAAQIDPKDARARYALGRTAERLGNVREAVGQYQAAIEADPKLNDARAALARLFLFGGLTDKAKELVDEGLKDAPDTAGLLTVRAAIKSNHGDTEGAFADARHALELLPADEYAIAMLAGLHLHSGQEDQAADVVRSGLQKLPDSIDLHTMLADLEMRQRHEDLAEAELKKIIELEPQRLDHRYRLARFYLVAKNVAAAESTLRTAIQSMPDSVEAKLALVEMLAAQRSREVAEKELQSFAAAEPGNDKLKLALAGYYERRNQYETAEKTLRAVIDHSDLQPDGIAARNRLAAMFLSGNKTDEATRLIEEVLHESPRDNDALVMRGNIALSRGDAPAAITDLRSVLRDQPNAVPVLRALARAHMANREAALAEEALRKAVQANPADRDARLELAQLLAQSEKPEQARPILEQLAHDAPNNAAVLENLFRVQSSLKDYAAAQATADAVTKLFPDKAVGYYFAGLIDEATNHVDAAIDRYQHALQVQVDAAEPLTALVRLHLSRKQPERALQVLDTTIRTAAHPSVARNLRAEVMRAQGNSVEAAAEYRRAIEAAPSWWIPYRGLAQLQVVGKNLDGAVATLRDGLEKTRQAPVLITELGSLLEHLGRSDDAIALYDDWHKRDPKSIVAANNLAMLLANYRNDKGSLTRALKLTEQLANSEEPVLLDTRGWVHYKAGDYVAAQQLLGRALDHAVDKSRQSPVMHYHLGMAQLAGGDLPAARKSLETALESSNSFLGADEAQATLKKLQQQGA